MCIFTKFVEFDGWVGVIYVKLDNDLIAPCQFSYFVTKYEIWWWWSLAMFDYNLQNFRTWFFLLINRVFIHRKMKIWFVLCIWVMCFIISAMRKHAWSVSLSDDDRSDARKQIEWNQHRWEMCGRLGLQPSWGYLLNQIWFISQKHVCLLACLVI